MGALVLKFGGSSVSTPKKFLQVADIIIERAKEYPRIIVVVSAMGSLTNKLLSLAHKVHPQPPRREQDMLITVGERISSALLAMALQLKGKLATSFTGSQAGIVTSDNHSEAVIVDVRPWRITSCLEEGKIAIIAGFQGVSGKGEITTLGRGGSDTSAVALAVALGAQEVEFYKDVPYIFSSDPKKDSQAQAFSQMSYEEAFALMEKGAKILHPRCVDLAAKNKIRLHVLSYNEFWKEDIQKIGTFVGKKEERKEKPIYEQG